MKKSECVSRSALFGCVILLAVWACAGTAQATLYTAKGSHTGDWADPTTWTSDNGTWPGNGDDVQIVNAGSVVIISGSTGFSV